MTNNIILYPNSLPHRGPGHLRLLQHDPRAQVRPRILPGRHRLLHRVEQGQREPRRSLQVWDTFEQFMQL